jgi:hypothetical protein
MKIAKLRWVGQVIRMSDSEMSKRIMNYNTERKRRAGNPKARARWIDAVDTDMRNVGVRNWRKEAKDRDGRRRILEEANAHL